MRLLLLAGTPEAIQIAHAVSLEHGVSALASIARKDSTSFSMNMPVRVGGWGGDDAFRDWLARERMDAVIDATHPFAERISRRTAEVAGMLNIPYVQFLRPSWTPGESDNWTFLNSEQETESHVPKGATVLLATGHRRLDKFGALKGRRVLVRVRSLRDDPFPFESGGFLHRPVSLPVVNERAGLRSLGVDWMVARNTGGGSGAALIEAARLAGVPVGMIRRPPQPQATRIHTVSEAVAWVRRRREGGD